MIKKWGLPLAGVLVAATVLVAAAGAIVQPPAPYRADLSSRAGVAKYLESIGVDAKGVVIQRGQHNYAGPSCPGVRWTCTTAKRVLQIASGTKSDNKFECTASSGFSSSPGECTIVQDSDGPTNSARCVEKSNTTLVSQSCVIFQTNTTGDNHLDIQQQVDLHGGATQSATQYAGTNQQNVSGKNDAHIQQDIHQETNDSGLGGAQSQEGHQGVSVTQNSGTGDNRADVDQSLALHAESTGKISVVNQKQDATDSGPNTNAGITQNSTSGKNTANLNQSNDLKANAPDKAGGSQTQGSPSGGLNGYFSQNSTGVSTVSGAQHEHQDLGGAKHPNMSQTQYGPAWFDPSQGSNLGDRYDLDQHSDQHASSSAFQSNHVFANCDTTGNCTANEDINQNGNHQKNSCSGSSCDIGLSCTSGVEGFCGPVSCDGECGAPAPPTPPFRGCEFDNCDVILSHG